MVKDRLQELQALAVIHNNGKSVRADVMDVFHIRLDDTDENTGFLRTDDAGDVEMFLNRVETTKRQINEMQQCLVQMKKIHSEILISPGVHSKFTDDLNETVEKFKKLTHIVSNSVKAMNAEAALSGRTQDANTRIKINQATTISRKLHELLFQFNNEQIIYRDKCKAKINSYLSIAGLKVPEEEVNEAIEKGQLFNTVGILMAERDKKLLFDDVKSRHEDIVRLENSIRELHDMFQDMAMLVETQSCMVNSIEANVANTVEYTNKALYSVNYAKESKRRNIKLKICLLIFIIIAILVLFSVGGAMFCFYFPFMCR